MNEQQTDWDLPELSDEDERLVNAYLETGRTVDDLAYTPAMSAIAIAMGEEDTDEAKRRFLLRLYRLRKMGRLPRLRGRASA